MSCLRLFYKNYMVYSMFTVMIWLFIEVHNVSSSTLLSQVFELNNNKEMIKICKNEALQL